MEIIAVGFVGAQQNQNAVANVCLNKQREMLGQ